MYSSEVQKRLYERSKFRLKNATAIPTQKEAAEEISELCELIVYHEWRYYNLDNPVISDYEYDFLYKRLEALEANYPDLLRSDSPTQRVSSDLSGDFETVAHLTPTLSLDNSYNAEDLGSFDERVKKHTEIEADQPIEYVVEPKFDGGTIVLVYENDQLVRGATRGNGRQGDDITNNARAMRTIPLSANFSKYGIHKVELRGEAIIRKDRFDQVNQKREKNGDSILANARNAATGALRVKDSKEVKDRELEAFVYQMGYAIDTEGNNVLGKFQSHDEQIVLLGNLGFKIPTLEKGERKVCKNIEEVAAFCNQWQEQREDYLYEIDGMVVKVNSLALQDMCGYTSHHPRWAIAFKFKAKQATTKLLNIEYQIGKIGSITPVAKLEPVQLAGVTVSSVSLHNEDFITSKDLRLGDTVLVERAGDVIPYIVKAMDELRDGSEQPIEFPRQCPDCGTDLIREENEAAWRCTNAEGCESQVTQRLIFHVSKPAMNIDGFGKAYVELFYENGWLKNLADVYRLPYEDIKALPGFGQRSVDKLEKAITKAKSNPLHRLLHSLSVHHLGKKASKLIAAEIKHVLDLQNWTEEDYTIIKDIGPTVAQNVMAFFAEPSNIELLKTLEELGVNVAQTEADIPEELVTDGVFSGKTILFTGKFATMNRNEAKKRAIAAGAKAMSGVSSKLNILVVGEKAGSKLKKAEALGTVQIMTEDEFIKLIEEV